MDTDNPEFTALLEYLRQNRGFDFTGYKLPSLMRRISKRMQMVNVPRGYSNYNDYLEVHPDEFTHLFNTILINVTDFFRDPDRWRFGPRKSFPRSASSNLNDSIRVWSAGCV